MMRCCYPLLPENVFQYWVVLVCIFLVVGLEHSVGCCHDWLTSYCLVSGGTLLLNSANGINPSVKYQVWLENSYRFLCYSFIKTTKLINVFEKTQVIGGTISCQVALKPPWDINHNYKLHKMFNFCGLFNVAIDRTCFVLLYYFVFT